MGPSRTSTARPTRDGAFTLVEVVAVLALVVTVAALVLPRLAIRPHDLSAAADALARRLTEARWRAVVEARAVTVTLPATDGVRALSSGDPPREPARAPALTFDVVPAAVSRAIVLVAEDGERARLVVPPGLDAITIEYEAPS